MICINGDICEITEYKIVFLVLFLAVREMFESIACDDVVGVRGEGVQHPPGHAVHVVPHHPHHGPVQLHHGDLARLVVVEEVGQESPVTSAQDEHIGLVILRVGQEGGGVDLVSLRQLDLTVQQQHSAGNSQVVSFQ